MSERLVHMMKTVSGHMEVWRAVHGEGLAVDGAWTRVVRATVERILTAVHEGVWWVGKNLWPIVSNVREGCSPGHGDVVGVAHGGLNVVLVCMSGLREVVSPVSAVILRVSRVLVVVVVVDWVNVVRDVVVFGDVAFVELVKKGATGAWRLRVGGVGVGPHVSGLERMGLWYDSTFFSMVVKDGTVDCNVYLRFEICVGGMEGGMHVCTRGRGTRSGGVRVRVGVVLERVHGYDCLTGERERKGERAF